MKAEIESQLDLANHDRSATRGETSLPVQMRHSDILVFCVVVGVAYTLWRYFFGFADHLEQLPPIYRLLDNSFCKGDYFVDEFMRYNPRYYFFHLMAMLGRYVPLDWSFLVLCAVCNVSMMLITYYGYLNLIGKSVLGPMLSCTLVGSVYVPEISGSGALVWDYFLPASLSTPLAFCALWAGLRQRPFLCAGLAALGSLPHPLIGLETGLLGLAGGGVGALFEIRHEPRIGVRRLLSVLVATALLVGFGYVVWIAPQEVLLNGQRLRDIIRFWCPFHFIPSTFGIRTYISTIPFLVCLALVWKWWYNDPATNRVVAVQVLAVLGMVLIGWLGGYVFVDLIPTRLFISAQVFRLRYVISWLGLLLLGRSAASALERRSGPADGFGPALLLMGAGYLRPAVMLSGLLLDAVQRRLGRRITLEQIFAVFGLLLMIACYLNTTIISHEYEYMAIFLAVVSWFVLVPPSRVRLAVPVIMLVCYVAIMLFARGHHVPFFSKRAPVIALNESRATTVPYIQDQLKIDGAARFCRDSTPPGTLFLIPPQGGRFRLVSRRPVVVEVTSSGLTERGLIEHNMRMKDCIAEGCEVRTDSFSPEMTACYEKIDDQRLIKLAAKYHFQYAVLYRQTPTALPVVYEDDAFRVVRVPHRPSSDTSRDHS